MASTPPPPSPSMLREPRAPRHGPKYDNYEPYPTRSSTRLANQRMAKVPRTTPPPSHPSVSTKTGTAKRTLSPSSPGTVKPSPKKAARTHQSSSSRVSPFDSEPSHPRTSAHQSSRSSAERALPTPAKTPSRKKEINSGSITSRALFPPSSTSKRRKMESSDQLDEPHPLSYEPFKVHSDRALGEKLGRGASSSTAISIHTDARDQIPVTDSSKGNPFTKPESSAARRPATRSTTAHDEGAWYVCRGKKIYRPFDEMEDEGEDESDLGLFASRPDLLAKNSDCLKGIKPLKRSDIKPKVLFRLDDKPLNDAEVLENEEDVTDVEDNEVVSPSPNHATYTYDNDPVEPEGSDLGGGSGLRYPLSVGSDVASLYSGTPFSEDLRSPSHCSTLSQSLTGVTPFPRELRANSQGSGTGGSLFDYWTAARKTRARQLETPADRTKRHREARGSPHPRTRMAKRAEASAALASAEEAPSTDV